MQAKGGELRDVQVDARAISIGGKAFISSIWHDVTERRRAEQDLRFHSQLLDSARESLVATDLEGDVIYWGKGAEELYGYRAEEVMGKPITFIVDPEARAEEEERMAQVLATGSWSGEYVQKRKDGSTFWADTIISLVRDEAGKPAAFIGIDRDITDRRQAIERIRQLNEELEKRVAERTADLRKAIRDLRYEARQRGKAEDALVERSKALDAFFRHSITPLVILDREFNFIRVNQAYAKSTGREVSEFPGKNHFDLYPSDAREVFEEVVRARRPFEAVARPFTFPDHPEWGVTYWDWTLVPLLDAEGEVESLVFSLKDVTEPVQAQTQLKALNDTLAQRARQLRALALELTRAEQRERRRLGRMLHDHLQQLLVGARMSLSLAGRDLPEGKLAERIRDADAMLGESLVASRTLTVELSPPILHDAGLGPALEWLARWMGERHGLTVELAETHWTEPQSEDVRVLVFHSVRELLFNVVKHAQVKQAKVEIDQVDGLARVRVVDEGVGFDPDATSAGEDMPTAFGLFSIRERLEAIGGALSVQSRPGEGTVATVVAPLDMATGDTDAADEADPAADGVYAVVPASDVSPRGPRIRVLLAEDHEVVREGLAGLLSHEPDIQVVAQAADGPAAVTMARETQPDVVIMDMSMPGLNGAEATRLILRFLPDAKVIALSTYEEDDMATRMREAGATAYLTKGGPAQSLVEAIRAAFAAGARADTPQA